MCTSKPILIAAFTALCALLSISSCEDERFILDCSKCYENEPLVMNMNISVTINDENPQVNFTVYNGDFETGEPIFYGTTASSDYSLTVETNSYYTVVAEYCSQGRSIMSIDGKMFYYEHNASDCALECYMIYGNDFDVKLKY